MDVRWAFDVRLLSVLSCALEPAARPLTMSPRLDAPIGPPASAETAAFAAVPPRVQNLRWVGPVGVAAAVAPVYIVFGAWQWSQFTVKSWDLSIFAQLLDRYDPASRSGSGLRAKRVDAANTFVLSISRIRRDCPGSPLRRRGLTLSPNLFD
jgi:hypothetical protein